MDDVAFLPVQGALTTDALGRPSVSTDSWRQVFVTVGSVSYDESQKAAHDGLTASYKLQVFYLDYGQETEIRFHDKVYRIYRSFFNPTTGKYELYLAERAGVSA